MLRQYFTFFVAVFFFACSQDENNKELFKARFETQSVFETKIKYAKGFNISNYTNYRAVTIRDPWQGAKDIKYSYILIDKDLELPDVIKDAPIIRTPVERVVCLSTTHISLLEMIGETGSIVGVSGSQLINNRVLKQAIADGLVADVGYDQGLNYELLISLRPDVVITYGIDSESASFVNKLKELGIKVVINAEYLEESPLAKTEWVKFIASFFNKEKLADEKFSEIERKYLEIKQKLSKEDRRPLVMSGLPWQGTWYVSGGESYLAHLIADAGGEYLWSENKSRESFPVSLEVVFAKSRNADIWINAGEAGSLAGIIAVEPRLNSMRPFLKQSVFNNNAIMNSAGGNDYWESGVAQPHVILQDLASIFHPSVFPKYNKHYYKQLK